MNGKVKVSIEEGEGKNSGNPENYKDRGNGGGEDVKFDLTRLYGKKVLFSARVCVFTQAEAEVVRLACVGLYVTMYGPEGEYVGYVLSTNNDHEEAATSALLDWFRNRPV